MTGLRQPQSLEHRGLNCRLWLKTEKSKSHTLNAA